MVRTIIILTTIIIICPIFALAELKTEIEFGTYVIDREFYSKSMIGYEYDLLKIKQMFYGGWETHFTFSNKGLIADSVLYDIYTFGYLIKLKSFIFGIEHNCKHPEKKNINSDAFTKIYMNYMSDR